MLISCGIHISGMRKNFTKSEILAEDLYKKNGNAFIVTSTYANFSQVWSYKKGYRIRFDLTKGVIKQQDTIKSDFYDNYLSEPLNFEGIDPLLCPELDGGLFLIRMKNHNANKKVLDYNSVNLKCIFRSSELKGFMKALVEDVDFIHPVFLEE